MAKNRFNEAEIYGSLSSLKRVVFRMIGTLHFGAFVRGVYLKKSLKGLNSKGNIQKIIDIGCGNGAYDFYIKGRYNDSVIDAIDIDNELISKNKAMSRRLGLAVNFIRQDITRFNAHKRYDLAISMDSLEHIKMVDIAVHKIYNCLKDNGKAIIHLPQKDWEEVSFFDKNSFRDFNSFEKKEHISAKYSLEEFVIMLKREGFTIIKAKKSFGYVGKLAWEINQLFQERKCYRTRLVILPFLKMIGLIDYYMPNLKGSGIFVIAERARK